MSARTAFEAPLQKALTTQETQAAARRARARKRLCIVVPSHWERAMGGAEYQVALLIEGLKRLDRFDIHYVTRRAPPPDRDRGYTVHAVGDGRPPGGAFFLDTPRLWRALERIRPDVIYQRVACGYTGIAAHYARRHGCRMVWHVASDGDLLPPKAPLSWRLPIVRAENALIDHAARRANAIVVQTRAQADLLRSRFGRDDATHIRNFHPMPAEPPAKPHDVVRIGWIGNMKAVKRAEIFVRLARDLSHLPGVELVMLGAHYPIAAQREQMARQVASLPNLEHLGEVPTAAVNQFLAGSHILVNTSAFEGFSNTFIQAWQRDVVVASLAVNPDGVFDDDRYGVYAGGDYDELVASLTRLVQNPSLRAEIAGRARVLARDQFSERNIERLAEVLDPSFTA